MFDLALKKRRLHKISNIRNYYITTTKWISNNAPNYHWGFSNYVVQFYVYAIGH